MSTVLLIDDDDLMRASLRQMIEDLGHEVCVASTGRKGLRMVEELAPDLVITNLTMPDRDGFEIIIELRHTRPELGIVAMVGGTRFNEDTLLTMALQLGARSVLKIPFVAGDVERSVGLAVALHESADAAAGH